MLQQTLERTGTKSITIEVFGLGYVGFPLAVRLASAGYSVHGIDTNKDRISQLQSGTLQESELHLEQDFQECITSRYLTLNIGSTACKDRPKIGIICVPTPPPVNGTQSDIYVRYAVDSFLRTAKQGDIIIIESSIEIGTTERMKDRIETEGYKIGTDFGLVFCPERIDPQNTKWNLENIPRVIYSSDDLTYMVTSKIYNHVNNSNLVRVYHPKVAETVKSYENAFRLVNISLVNELAILCDSLKINVMEVINAAATKPFGFMPFYPGAGSGGHCIPKDPRFLLESSKKFGSEFNTISNALAVNAFMPGYVCRSIDGILEAKRLPKNILVCGVTYKQDIEDMRDSPGFKILRDFLDRGYSCALYDPYFKPNLSKKYLKENNMTSYTIRSIPDLDDERLRETSCICIVQYHSKTKFRLEEIYTNSAVPVIYDCQGRMTKNSSSSTLLKQLGGQ